MNIETYRTYALDILYNLYTVNRDSNNEKLLNQLTAATLQIRRVKCSSPNTINDLLKLHGLIRVVELLSQK
jgi:hypothetical protein